MTEDHLQRTATLEADMRAVKATQEAIQATQVSHGAALARIELQLARQNGVYRAGMWLLGVLGTAGLALLAFFKDMGN